LCGSSWEAKNDAERRTTIRQRAGGAALVTAALVTAALVTAALVTAALVTAALVTAALVTAALVTAALVTAALVTARAARYLSGVRNRTREGRPWPSRN
jgi:hypothetical protein